MSKKETTTQTQETVQAAPVFNFTVVKNVTLPLIKPEIDVPVFVKVTSAVFVGKDIAEKTPGAKKKEPAKLINCINLQTGEEAQLIVPSVLAGIFTDEYKDDSYVGKCFQLIKHAKKAGKEYHPFTVREIKV